MDTESPTLSSIYVPKDTIHRLVKDVKHLRKHPLHDQGIYYVHDSQHMLKGYAMMVGPENTPYHGGYYFFEFDFPPGYPHVPPRVKYHTNGQMVRFNPNLYIDGKVCVSLLNTWAGEQWTSCQTIASVLLTLCSLLCEDPLLNEPDLSPTLEEIQEYNHVVEYANVSIAVCDILLKTQGVHQPFFDLFRDIVVEQFRVHLPSWTAFVEKHANEEATPVYVNTYDMQVTLDFKELRNKLEQATDKIK